MRQLSLPLTLLICVLTLCVVGCSPAALSLEHKIDVPPAYNFAAPSEAGVTPAQSYRDAYERGWWSCIAERIRALNEACRNIAPGRPSEVFGYMDGSEAADKRVTQLLEIYGQDKTLSYLMGEYNRSAVRAAGKKEP